MSKQWQIFMNILLPQSYNHIQINRSGSLDKYLGLHPYEESFLLEAWLVILCIFNDQWTLGVFITTIINRRGSNITTPHLEICGS